MNNVIPYGRQDLTAEDFTAVLEALKSDYLTQGPRVNIFEKEFADYVGCKYAVAVANGTAALHLSTLALGLGKGKKVITTPITFAASANCVRYQGGEVVFADIDPDSFLLDVEKVRQLLKASPRGTYEGIIPVDFAGRAVNLEALKDLANEYNLWIIQDACHALGGFFLDSRGKKQFCGNGNFADLAVFSFHPVKHITCGEGGMITTNNKILYERLVQLRTHGITKDSDKFINTVELAGGKLDFPGWYMEMQELGYNYRITDFQAALGSSQLSKAETFLEKRKKIAENYYKAFRNKDFVIAQSEVIEGHAYHLYILEVKNRLGLYNFLREEKIFTQVHYIPCHLMPYYRSLGWKEGDMPHAESYYKHCISLPMFPGLKDEEQDYVIEKILDFYG